MNPCAQQVRLFNEVVPQLTQQIGARHAIPVAEKLNWQLVGCAEHRAILIFPMVFNRVETRASGECHEVRIVTIVPLHPS